MDLLKLFTGIFFFIFCVVAVWTNEASAAENSSTNCTISFIHPENANFDSTVPILYTGAEIEPNFMITLNISKEQTAHTKTFSKKDIDDGKASDFQLSYYYLNNINAGTASILVYQENILIAKQDFTIRQITSEDIKDIVCDIDYIGGRHVVIHTANVILKNGMEVSLTEEQDYRVQYSSNDTISDKITGESNFSVFLVGGENLNMQESVCLEVRHYDTIIAKELSENDISISNDELFYNGKELKPTILIETEENAEMILNEDYTIEYTNNKNSGTMTLSVQGITPYYSGVVTITKEIHKYDISNANILITGITYHKDTGAIPTVIVKDAEDKEYIYQEGIDYTIDIKNNTIIGKEGLLTITGINNCQGVISQTFLVANGDITNSYASYTKTHSYTGAPIILSNFQLYNTNHDGAQWLLTQGVDYEIIGYSHNIEAGTAYIHIKGIGDYVGTKTFAFDIIPITNITFQYDESKKTYTSFLKSLIIKSHLGVLQEGIDYIVTHKAVGDDLIIHINGILNYNFSQTITINTMKKKITSKEKTVSQEIKPIKKVTKLKIKKKKKRIILSWGKISKSKGYQIVRSKKKKGVYRHFKYTKTNQLKIKKTKKKYYYKIRAYRIINKKKHYGKFSISKCI